MRRSLFCEWGKQFKGNGLFNPSLSTIAGYSEDLL